MPPAITESKRGPLVLGNLAIAHDALVCRGGAERVVEALVSRWGPVPVYTSAYLPNDSFERLRTANIQTSFLQHLARSREGVMRRLFPLMIPAFRSFDFTGYDVVLSSAAYAAKSVRVPDRTCHVCYCYTPLRLAWRPGDYCSSGTTAGKRATLFALAALLRRWDYRVAQRVDYFATTCKNVARRIWSCYDRDAEVINAPIDCSRYRIGVASDYYLVVSRLNKYKRIDLAIEAMSRLGRRLLVVGDGPARRELETNVHSEKIRFLGVVPDDQLRDLYSGCRALIFPQEEDYGLTPLEAQASGRPVIAFAAGGALETIVDGKTGWLFEEQTSEALQAAVRRAEETSLDPMTIRQHAKAFDVEIFCDKLAKFLDQKLQEFSEDRSQAKTKNSRPARNRTPR